MSNPYAEAAAGMNAPANRYAADAADLAETQRTALRTSVYGVTGTPEQAASAVRLGRQAGLPVDLVQRNLPAVERRVTTERIDSDTLASPVLRSRYADPTFAALAHDDSTALASVERVAGAYTFGNALKKGFAGGKLTFDFLADQLARAAGAARTETQRVLQETMGFYRAQGADLELQAAGERAKAAGGGTWYGTLAHLPGEVAAAEHPFQVVGKFLTEQLPASLVGFGIGAAATAPLRAAVVSKVSNAMVAKGVSTGLAGASGNGTAVVVQSLGANYAEGLSKGMQPQEAASRAWTKTLAEVPANAVAGAAMGLKLGPNQLTNIFGQAGVQGAGGGIGAAQAAGAVGEQADPVEIALEVLGQAVSTGPELAGLTFSRIAESRAAKSAEAAAAAQEDAVKLGEIIKASDGAALKARDPQTFAKFVEQVQPEARLYVAPEHLAAVDLTAVPEIAAQVAEAQATGGDVQISLADLVAHLPGEKLLPHLRTSPDAMTAAESGEFDGPTEIASELLGRDAGATAEEQARFAAEELAKSGGAIETFLEGSKLSPAVQNLLIGMHEAGSNAARSKAMLADFERTARNSPGRSLMDVAADVVDSHRGMVQQGRQVVFAQDNTSRPGAPQSTTPGTESLIRSQGTMSPDEWAEYQTAAADAAQSAVEYRDARLLKDMEWLGKAESQAARVIAREAAAARVSIEAEVKAEIEQQAEAYPQYAVQRWLKTGTLPDGSQSVGAKLNTEALRAMYGDGPAAPWRYLATNMVTANEGLHPDVVAETFGFASGDEMVRAILSAEPQEKLIERMTDERMLDQHPDIADAIARERSAEALIVDRARERFLATEAAALARAVGNRVLLAQEARRYAEQSIARRRVADVRPAQFKASGARAGVQAETAFRKGDTAVAAKWKQSQVLQAALQSEATTAAAEVVQALRTFKRMTKADDAGRDGSIANAARAMLTQYGLAASEKTADDYLAQVQRYDPDLHADLEALMDGLPAATPDHRSLTMGDFRTVTERVEALWSLARTTRQIEIDGQAVEISEAAAALAQQLGNEPAAKREQMVGTNDRLDLRMRLAGVRAALRRVEHWADARDGGARDGPFRKFVWQPVSEAVTRYRAQRNDFVGRFEKLLKTIEPTLKPGKIAAPELKDGMVFADRSALLHGLLHTGNESNKRKFLLGYQFATERDDGSLDTSRWDAFLERMHAEQRITKKDWDFVQSTWNLLEETKPAAQAAHKKVMGFYFDEVVAEPVQTPFGELAGGYVPAITDGLLVPEARTHGAVDDMLSSQNSPVFPAVGRGFTKARIEDYTRPLALDLRLLPSHIDKVVRFSTLGPVLRDTARLVTRNSTFRASMDAVDPTAVESMLVPWLKRVATQTLTKAPETQADRAVARIATTVRNRTGLLLMAGNVVNTLQQLTGLSVAALRVNPGHLAAGMAEYVGSPGKSAEAIHALSPWMQQRSDDSARDVDQTINRLLTNPGPLERVEQLGTKYGYALQQTAQNFLDRVVWLGAYRQGEAAGVTDAQAVRDADSAVRMTQGSFAPEDAAKVEHAGAFTRLFLQFFSYFGGQFNLLATEAQNARDKPGRLALVYLLGFAVPAFVADVIAKGARGQLGGDDDDDLAVQLLESFFLSQARYALGMAPVVGQVGNAALGQFTPERFDDRIGASPTYSALEATVRAPGSVYRALAEDGNPRAAVRDGLTAVGLLTGIPTGPLIRPLGYLADEEAESTSALDTARGLITGR